MGRKPKFPVERAIEKFFDSARIYLFERPKNDMDRMAHSMELISFILLGIALLLRIR